MKVRKEKVQNALQWLNENNPHYAGVDINLEALNSLPENRVPADILTVDTVSEVFSDKNTKPESTSEPCSLNSDEDLVYNSSSEMSSFFTRLTTRTTRNGSYKRAVICGRAPVAYC